MMTIRSKIVIASTAVFMLLSSGLSLSVYESFKQKTYDLLDAHMRAYAQELQAEVEEQHSEGVFLNVAELRAVKPEGLGTTFVRLMDSTGSTLYADSAVRLASSEPWIALTTSKEILRNFKIQNTDYRVLWCPVEVRDRNMYALQVASSISDVESSLRHLRLLFFLAIPLALLLFGFAVNLIIARGFRPVSDMIKTSRNISSANLDERIAVPKGRDEIFDLGTTLNEMMERIAAAFKSQKQFVADASHEIRTPLAILQSELEYSARRSKDPATRRSIARSLDEVDRMRKLTDDLLLLARLDASKSISDVRLVRLDELLGKSLKRLRSLARRKRIRFALKVSEAVEVRANEDNLHGAISNVLENALKFSRPDQEVQVKLEKSNNIAIIRIHDSGPGIPRDDITLVFDRFHRTASSRLMRSGSGLGLPIARKIVELHGGRLFVESEVGRGSTFIFELPIATR